MINEPTSPVVAPAFWAVQLEENQHDSLTDTAVTIQFTRTGLLGLQMEAGKNTLKTIGGDTSEVKLSDKFSSNLKSFIQIGDGVIGAWGVDEIDRIGIVVKIHISPFAKAPVEIEVEWKIIFPHRIAFENEIFNIKRSPFRLDDDLIEALKLPLEVEKNITRKVLVKPARRRSDSTSPSHRPGSGRSMGRRGGGDPPPPPPPDSDGDYEDMFYAEDTDDDSILTGDIVTEPGPARAVQLFFGTNRIPTGKSDWGEYYGNEYDNELREGICSVNIPPNKKQGETPRPFRIPWIYEFPEREDKHVMIKLIRELEERVFLDFIQKELSRLKENTGLIFVHGFNNTFEEAAWRAGQLAWDMPFKGIVGFYSWPAIGSYLADEARVRASVEPFKKFVIQLLEESGLQKIHILAHSMGNVLLTESLNQLASDVGHKKLLHKIQQIVLAAPDIDQSIFRNSILPYFKDLGMRRTIYASDRDIALRASGVIRKRQPRLGFAGSHLFVSEWFDTVDASKVGKSSMGHSYVFQTREMLTDLHLLLNMGFAPKKRRLRDQLRENLTYWLYPW
ncbi:MAG: alpha/beta hydrolase [Imperialibacter sp.]|uniref:alpha/beta hydrolase n=1 Tax=Imperialibacter sp. TaxID=2038411 RepID=UPI0032EB2BEE